MRMIYLEVTKGLQLDKDMVGNVNFNDYRYRYDYKGFCSIVNQIIDIAGLHQKHHNNFNVIINEPQTLNLFNPKFNGNTEDSYDSSVFFLEEFFNGRIDNTYNAHTLANVDDLKRKKMILDSILEIKPELISQFEIELQNLMEGENFIGIQLRGTDKVTEISEAPIDNIFKHIDDVLNETKINKIFLATDDMKYLSAMTNRYGEDVVKYNTSNLFSHDSKPLHMTTNREKINLDVLRDVYFLKNSKYLCYTYSNVGYLALIMGIDNLQGFKNLNEI